MEWKSIKDDGLPPLGAALMVTIYDTIRNRRELRYPVVYRHAFYHDGYGFYEHGLEEHQLLTEYSQVLAWAEMPKVYEGEMK